MKKNFLLIVACLTFGSVMADNVPTLPGDSSKVVDIEEVVIVASPKENAKLRSMPLASTLLSQEKMEDNHITSSKDLSFYSPNLYIPDYGQSLTSPIYLRGVGSRLGTPAVGLYVDNVPYIDKSAYNFNFSDVDRIDVLRGPQGTLYGLNSMGGLIKIHTKSPMDYQGTDIDLGCATYSNYNASLTHYHRISDKFAFSVGGFINHKGGFYKNVDSAYNKKIDWENTAGGRLHAIYLPTDSWKIDLNANYEYVSQGGNPYENLAIGKVSYNAKSGYNRNLVDASLDVEHTGDNYVMTAVTGFQYLKDHMDMDQDYTSKNYFTLMQRQNQHTFTEEITFRSKPGSRYDWVCGAFAYDQHLNTTTPMTFGSDFISYLQQEMDAAMTGPVNVTLTDNAVIIPGTFKTPSQGAALFHQSAFHDLFGLKGLTATIGLRADLQHVKVNYDTSASMNYTMSMGGHVIGKSANSASFVGDTAKTYFQLLPKFALQYDFNADNNIYATVSRGYRGGGYNIESLSDLLSNALEGSSSPTSASASASKANAAISYKPEYTWSYEVGTHTTLVNKSLWIDGDIFCMQTRNQQIAKVNSLGSKEISNAGKSRSYGGEFSLKAALDKFTFNADYGYTHATFNKYATVVNNKEVDYNGNYVPFIPQHTFSLGAEYTALDNATSCIKALLFGADYSGAANIRWDEANTTKQPFYATFNAHATMKMNHVSVCLWWRNILDKQYQTFYFSELGSNFAKYGSPAQAGIDVRLSF